MGLRQVGHAGENQPSVVSFERPRGLFSARDPIAAKSAIHARSAEEVSSLPGIVSVPARAAAPRPSVALRGPHQIRSPSPRSNSLAFGPLEDGAGAAEQRKGRLI